MGLLCGILVDFDSYYRYAVPKGRGDWFYNKIEKLQLQLQLQQQTRKCPLIPKFNFENLANLRLKLRLKLKLRLRLKLSLKFLEPITPALKGLSF